MESLYVNTEKRLTINHMRKKTAMIQFPLVSIRFLRRPQGRGIKKHAIPPPQEVLRPIIQQIRCRHIIQAILMLFWVKNIRECKYVHTFRAVAKSEANYANSSQA